MKKTICFDFDGVIAKYDRWPGFDVFGDPIQETIAAMKRLKDAGYYIIIWTTRLDTPGLRTWLKQASVPYDALNSTAHNPPNTSQKPIYHVVVDDRAVEFKGQSCDDLVNDILNKIVKLEG